jgi:hypothetical protein
MKPIYARKIIDENGNEIIELDLNKPLPNRQERFDMMNQLGKAGERQPRRQKEFITLVNQ